MLVLNVSFYLLISPIKIIVSRKTQRYTVYYKLKNKILCAISTALASIKILYNFKQLLGKSIDRGNDPLLYFEITTGLLQILLQILMPIKLYQNRLQIARLLNLAKMTIGSPNLQIISSRIFSSIICTTLLLYSGSYVGMGFWGSSKEPCLFNAASLVCKGVNVLHIPHAVYNSIRSVFVDYTLVLIYLASTFFQIISQLMNGYFLFVTCNSVYNVINIFNIRIKSTSNIHTLSNPIKYDWLKSYKAFCHVKSTCDSMSMAFGTIIFAYLILIVISTGRYLNQVAFSIDFEKFPFMFHLLTSISLFILAAEIVNKVPYFRFFCLKRLVSFCNRGFWLTLVGLLQTMALKKHYKGFGSRGN